MSSRGAGALGESHNLQISPSPAPAAAYGQSIHLKNGAPPDPRAIMRMWESGCTTSRRFGIQSTAKQEQNRSLRTKRRYPANRFACNKPFQNRETYVSENGENVGLSGAFHSEALHVVERLTRGESANTRAIDSVYLNGAKLRSRDAASEIQAGASAILTLAGVRVTPGSPQA